MPDKEVVRDVAETMFGEARDPDNGFTLNVIHHHHEHVVVTGVEPQQNLFEMMLQMKLFQSIAAGFSSSALLDSKSETPMLIESDKREPTAEDVDYEVVGEEPAPPVFMFEEPKFNPVFDGKKYYEILSSVFFSGWKMVIRDMKIETPFAIIILENVIDDIEESRRYVSIYGSMPIFTKAMYGKNAPKSQTIPRNWDHAPYFVELLKEAEVLAKSLGQKFVYYIEEIDLEGKKRFDTILSNDIPKTEITEFHSIFAFKPDTVYTNFERNVFRVEFAEDSFVIKRD